VCTHIFQEWITAPIAGVKNWVGCKNSKGTALLLAQYLEFELENFKPTLTI
jgi:hypothetical protein